MRILRREAYSWHGQLLLPGSRGELVKQLQERLLAFGFDPGPIDGVYGLLTGAAVRELQRAFGLREDGRAGPQVWQVLSDPLARATLLTARPDDLAMPTLASLAATFSISLRTLAEANDLDPHAAGPMQRPVRVPLAYRLGWPSFPPPRFPSPRFALPYPSRGLSALLPYLSGLVIGRVTRTSVGRPEGNTLEVLARTARQAGVDGWWLWEPAEAEKGEEGEKPARAGRAGEDAEGILVDARGIRLPDRLRELIARLDLLARCEPGIEVAVALPVPPVPGRAFARAFRRVAAALWGHSSRLWICSWRRPEDFALGGGPLGLEELDRVVEAALESWASWRVGLVLPAFPGFASNGRPLTRREVWSLIPTRAPQSTRRRSSPVLFVRDGASGLLMTGDGPSATYLTDDAFFRELLSLATRRHLGGLAVHPWEQAERGLAELLPVFSGRMLPRREASPGGSGIYVLRTDGLLPAGRPAQGEESGGSKPAQGLGGQGRRTMRGSAGERGGNHAETGGNPSSTGTHVG